MRSIVVEEWVHIPDGGMLLHMSTQFNFSYLDS